ncbi:hypothetical protein CP967_26635 [Streptomyces nitrosporeus]|uniref:Uncharacterized protein n=1 Tax=Streptomyces nitrosporeus TaxID=28894 RepID=A0A5J6FJF2_9ACTN|nr:hypothetical protein CP967_26635 [Streptomyces nitrosporeus]
MCASVGFPSGQEPPQVPAPNTPADCRRCQELLLAEAVATARHDPSAATDCRVLLRRHRETENCPERKAT